MRHLGLFKEQFEVSFSDYKHTFILDNKPKFNKKEAPKKTQVSVTSNTSIKDCTYKSVVNQFIYCVSTSIFHVSNKVSKEEKEDPGGDGYELLTSLGIYYECLVDTLLVQRKVKNLVFNVGIPENMAHELTVGATEKQELNFLGVGPFVPFLPS
ncbi:hypothetical protein DSO57_1023176 [Entomophthora muscae]|uniref:Uncharacterized protein n=1 Tax=Entomophthora muscae TaxID=34485 RepID=A0ACC2SFX8_9FUNG|nr:hypothetical protein DSO57_1023176 [Entomophthora muscae]